MPRKRLSMRQVHEVLRLKWAGGLSDRQIAQSLGLSRPTIAAYVQRAQAAGLSWPLPEGLDEATLERLLFPPPPTKGLFTPVAPDNLKAAVTRAHRYEPELNRTYLDLAYHYQVAIIPARAARPRDKAKVEVGVQVVERWILARLRHQTFFALAEVNAAVRALLPDLNARPFKKLPGSRDSLFAALDRPALRPLPAPPSEYA